MNELFGEIYWRALAISSTNTRIYKSIHFLSLGPMFPSLYQEFPLFVCLYMYPYTQIHRHSHTHAYILFFSPNLSLSISLSVSLLFKDISRLSLHFIFIPLSILFSSDSSPISFHCVVLTLHSLFPFCLFARFPASLPLLKSLSHPSSTTSRDAVSVLPLGQVVV